MSKIVLTDELLKEAAMKAMKIEASVYGKIADQAEEHGFSEEHEKKMWELIENNLGKARSKHTSKRMSLRIRIALVAVIVMMMGSMTVLAVEPLREKVYRMVERLFSDHTDVTFEEIEEEIRAQSGEVDMTNYPRRLKKVPEGYTLFLEEDFMEDPEIALPDFTQVYSNLKDQNLNYSQMLAENYDVSITSDGTSAKRIMVGNNQAYLFTDDDNYNGIIMEKDGFVYTLGGYDEVDELIACLEAVFEDEKFLNKN